MRSLFLPVLFFSLNASSQVSVQEYPIPRGLHAHDVWADAASGGPGYFSAQRSGHLGILDPKSRKVATVALGRGASPHRLVTTPPAPVCLTHTAHNPPIPAHPP